MVINNTKINLDQVCTINVYPKRVCRNYEYRKETRFLYWTLGKEGFYYIYTLIPFRVSEELISLEENIYVEGKAVYYKPYVELRMSDGRNHEKYFNTAQDLEDFMNSPEIQTIKLINKN